MGEKTNLNEELLKKFQKSSLAHILAVSGIHVSYVILAITFLININKLHKKSGYLLTIFFLIVFMFLTNFSVSVIRACLMAIIVCISKLLHRKADILYSLIITLLITLINNPYSIQNVSLQLSYLGTVGVIFLTPIIQELIKKVNINNKISKIISVPIAAQIAILPVMIKSFHTISLTFLLSNIIVTPLLGIVIILGFIAVLFSFIWMWAALKLGIVLNIILKLIIIIAKIIGSLQLSNIYVFTPKIVTILIYYFFLIILSYIFNLKKNYRLQQYEIYILNLYSKISRKKAIAYIVIIICLIEIPYTNYNGKLKIFFIDVGQR